MKITYLVLYRKFQSFALWVILIVWSGPKKQEQRSDWLRNNDSLAPRVKRIKFFFEKSFWKSQEFIYIHLNRFYFAIYNISYYKLYIKFIYKLAFLIIYRLIFIGVVWKPWIILSRFVEFKGWIEISNGFDLSPINQIAWYISLKAD